MKSQEITDKKIWNTFVINYGPLSGAFLHSWEWGNLQASVGAKVHRGGFYEANQLTMVALMIEKKLPFGFHYLFCPRGPIVVTGGDPNELFAVINDAGKKSGALFFRFEPPIENADSIEDKQLLTSIELHPANTILMDLTQSESELLAGMHQKTRYNIRLAEKKDVQVEVESSSSLDEVWPLFEKTASRGGFHLHPKPYYQAMLKKLSSDECRAFLSVAKFEGQIISANIMIDHANTRTYLHGASDHEFRQVMAPHLLHWELIRDAKEKGMSIYDWWGVAPVGVEKHPWRGITRFKEGFGGQRISYPGTLDMILKPASYKFYKMARGFVRKLRS